MNNLAEVIPVTESNTAFQSEHTRTHRRWAKTVLGLYGIIVSIGILATLAHRSMIVESTPPATHLAATAQTQ
jgi:hypothetical protein